MKKEKAEQILESEKVRSIGKDEDFLLNPKYIVEKAGGTLIYGSNTEISQEQLDEICYNQFGKTPALNPEYYDDKNIRFIIWIVKENFLKKKKVYVYNSNLKKWEQETN